MRFEAIVTAAIIAIMAADCAVKLAIGELLATDSEDQHHHSSSYYGRFIANEGESEG